MLLFNTKANLTKFMPSVIDLIGEQQISWTSIDRQFSERHAKLIEQSNGGSIRINASIYEVILSATSLGNRQAFGLYNFINKMFQDISSRLSLEEKRMIRPNLYNILTNLDSKYLNFVGEIALLNSLLKKGEYKLLGVEVELPNKKAIDFSLRNISSGNKVLVEVQNIQVNGERVEKNDLAIKKYLTKKIANKIEDKSAGLEPQIEFVLAPIIWGPVEALKIYSVFFQSNKLELKNVLEPASYITFSDGADYVFNRFGNISTLFDQPDEQTISGLNTNN